MDAYNWSSPLLIWFGLGILELLIFIPVFITSRIIIMRKAFVVYEIELSEYLSFKIVNYIVILALCAVLIRFNIWIIY